MKKEPIKLICDNCGIHDVWDLRLRFIALSILTFGAAGVVYIVFYLTRKNLNDE
jgi:hypothetical protein